MAAARRYLILGDLNLGASRPSNGAVAAALERGLLEGRDPDVGLIIVGNLLDVADTVLSAGGPRSFTENDSLARVDALTSQHKDVFDTLGRFLTEGGRATWLPADGDADLLWPDCRERLASALGPDAGAFRFQLRRSLRLPGGIWVEPGSGRFESNALPDLDDPISDGEVRVAPSTVAALAKWGDDQDGWQTARNLRPRSVALGEQAIVDVTEILDRAAAEILEERTGLAAVIFGQSPEARTPGAGTRGWWAPGPMNGGGSPWGIEVVVRGRDVEMSLLDLGEGGGDTRPAVEEAAPSVLIASSRAAPHVHELRALLEQAGADVEALTGATYDALVDILATGRHTALHLIAERRERNGRTELMLSRPDGGEEDPLRADDLVDLLLGTGVRMLVLEVSSTAGEKFSQDVLRRADLAGVAALAEELDGDERALFGREFWAGMAAGLGVHAAAGEAGGVAEGAGVVFSGLVPVETDEAEEPEAEEPEAEEPETEEPEAEEPETEEPETEGPEAEEPETEEPETEEPETEETPAAAAAQERRFGLVVPEGLIDRALAWHAAGRPIVVYGAERSGRRSICEEIARRTGLVATVVLDWDGDGSPPVLATAAGPIDRRGGRVVSLGPVVCEDPLRESEVAQQRALAQAGLEEGSEEFELGAAVVLGFVAVARKAGAVVGTGRVVDALGFLACALAAEAFEAIDAADEAIAVDLVATLSDTDPKSLAPILKWAAKSKGASSAAKNPPKDLARTTAALTALEASRDRE